MHSETWNLKVYKAMVPCGLRSKEASNPPCGSIVDSLALHLQGADSTTQTFDPLVTLQQC